MLTEAEEVVIRVVALSGVRGAALRGEKKRFALLVFCDAFADITAQCPVPLV